MYHYIKKKKWGKKPYKNPYTQQNTRILNKKTAPFEREDDNHYQKKNHSIPGKEVIDTSAKPQK
jgi:hypothetical protein